MQKKVLLKFSSSIRINTEKEMVKVIILMITCHFPSENILRYDSLGSSPTRAIHVKIERVKSVHSKIPCEVV